jgi:hypothetical protein
LLEQTRAAGALNVDETGWYLSGESRTLWGAFGKQTAVLRIAPDRGKQHRPTTPPNAVCAPPSSTASSHSAAARKAASAQ